MTPETLPQVIRLPDYVPSERQTKFHQSTAFEVFFGGAAGPGKSTALCGDAINAALRYPGHRVFFFRKSLVTLRQGTLPALMQQLAPYNNVPDNAKATLPDGRPLTIKYNGANSVFNFSNGSFIQFAYLRTLADIYNYSSIEMHLLLFDELTQFTEQEYEFLKTRVRSGDVGRPLQVKSASNPGDIGHNFVKERFIESIDPAVHYEPEVSYEEQFYDEDTQENYSRSRVFIPAFVGDNPNQQIRQEYRRNLNAIKDPQLRLALLKGDWNTFMGRVYTEWDNDLHVIPTLPRGLKLEDCSIYIGFDWGYHDPAVATWFAYAPENELGVRHLYAYREIHETGKTPKWWAKKIADIIKNEPIEYMILPHDCFSHLGGNQTIASTFDDQDVPYVRADSMSHAAKMHRIALMHDLLSPAEDDIQYLQYVQTCANNIRTIPTLPYSKSRPEEIDDKAQDHCLHGDTLVQTENGRIKIKDLVGSSGRLWSLGKLEDYHSVRQTGVEKIYELTFTDGSVVRCSADHLFLTKNGWVKAIDLDHTYMIQLHDESNDNHAHNPRVQWSKILPLRLLLPAQWFAFASSGVSIPQWRDSAGLSHSPQGQEPQQQSDRKFRDANPTRSPVRATPYHAGAVGDETEAYAGSGDTQSGSMAQVQGWSGVAQEALRRDEDGSSLSVYPQRIRTYLSGVWGKIRSVILSGQDLPRHMYTSLSLRTEKGEAPVYNLEVDSTHCFSVEAGITVHNCFDSSTYALMVIYDAEGYILNTDPRNDDEPEEYNTNRFLGKALRDSEKRWGSYAK